MFKLLIAISAVCFSVSANDISPSALEKLKSGLWSLQPPVKTVLPPKDKWCQNDIDRFVLKRMKENGLTPSAKADKRTLIRRAYYNLIGLPPTAEQVSAFLKDKSAKSYKRLIDQLLSQKEYGEKWARHWMDVARFADTKGYVTANKDRRYPYSYTYRDYLIRAFNQDKPYKQFILEQLAADKLALKDKRDLAALGFQTAAERFLGRQEEIVNDRIDVTTQGFLGLSVACARCHDHKFDPIPTADYYSLYGVFEATTEPSLLDLPVIGKSADSKLVASYEKKLAELQSEKDKIYEEYRQTFFDDWQVVAADYIDYIGRNITGQKGLKMIDRRGQEFRRRLLNDMQLMLRTKRLDPFFALWNKSLKAAESKIPVLVKATVNNKNSSRLLVAALKGKKITSKNELLKVYKSLLDKVLAQKKMYGRVYHSFAGDSFRRLLDKNDVMRYASNAEDEKAVKVNNKLSGHLIAPGSPARAMVVKDVAKPKQPYVFIRGKKSSRGPEVERRFLQALSYKKSHEKFTQGSGRLELAEGIADERNPLTARVLVNRVWHWHFGQGIVATPSNFGYLGSKPSHPQLLDYLAVWFMDNGWSIKKLNKLIMTSAVYKQKSDVRAEMAEADGANTYLWKMNRRRLSWEELRDSVVFSTGKLKSFKGGPSLPLLGSEYQPYRTVYGFLERDNIVGAAKAFDFPAAEITCEARSKTIVPQQGLFLMNSPFVLRSSRMIAAPIKGGRLVKINEIFKKVYGRLPSSTEVAFCQQFLATGEKAFEVNLEPRWNYGFATLTKADKLQKYTEFAVFGESRWQVSKTYPDKKLGHVMLTENGGHPGKGNLVAVRRSRMYAPGRLSIDGMIKHQRPNGDGVRALIMHNGVKIGEWNCRQAEVTTTLESLSIKAGDLIDFVVDSKTNNNSDSFMWPLKMALVTGNQKVSLSQDFKKERRGQNFSAWYGLAQVLMMSNEFLYVD